MIGDAPIWLTAALLLIVGAAAVWDIRSFTIPNAFPILIAGLFAVAFGLLGYGHGALALHLASAVIGFLLAYLLFAFKLMGGGDVKLFAAIALWLPLTRFIEFAVAVTLAGGVLAGAVLAVLWLGRLRKASHERPDRPLAKTRLPYGVAIFAGTLVVVLIDRL